MASLHADTLYDLADDDELLWRREGEGWDAEPEGEEGAQTVHLGEMAAAIEQAERWAGARKSARGQALHGEPGHVWAGAHTRSKVNGARVMGGDSDSSWGCKCMHHLHHH